MTARLVPWPIDNAFHRHNKSICSTINVIKRARGDQVTGHRLMPLQRIGPAGGCPRDLRERWRQTTLAAGWPFPSDWGVPAVDTLCSAVTAGLDPVSPLCRLGRARAETGAGLAETLQDLAALHTVLRQPGPCPVVDDPDQVPSRLIRAIALGWADVALAEVGASQVVDSMTGLATASYLRTRLSEIYRAAQADGEPASDRHILVLVSLDLSRIEGWTRLVPMVLAAEAMRDVFNGGQTHAVLGQSVAVVLTGLDTKLPSRTVRLRSLICELLTADPDATSAGPPQVWLERLPVEYTQACELLTRLSN